MLYKNVADMIGSTPLLELANIEKVFGLKAKLYAKIEGLNPSGSVKDRTAMSMIVDAEEKGLLKPGNVIIEPTSGNTGIGLASISSSRGYRLILTMPESMSIERRKLLRAYGAEIVLTPASEGMKGAVKKAEDLRKEIEGSIILGQFENPANPAIHYKTTGPEILEDLNGMVDIFVAGIGTGGTITGVGSYLKQQLPYVKIIGVEPEGSPFLSKGVAGKHGIQGIGAGFAPKTLDKGVLDDLRAVSDEDAYKWAKMVAKREGLLVGISSGAALCAAIEEANKDENQGKVVVVLFPDSGDRYLSTPLFED